MTLGELARRLECPVEGDAAIEIRRVAKIEEAGPGDLTFLANPKYASKLAATRASAVIMNGERDSERAPCAVIRSASPYLTFARAAQVLSPDKPPAAGVHALASVAGGRDGRSDRDDQRVRGDRRRRARSALVPSFIPTS